MTKKKTKTKSDAPGDASLHFFEKMILKECHMNTDLHAELPPAKHCDEFPDEEKGKWDPDDPSVFEHERDAEWLQGTWDDCLKKEAQNCIGQMEQRRRRWRWTPNGAH